jgi:large subunit ribosomal protein L22
MQVKAVAKFIRVQPRKVRIIADEIRGKNAAYAVSQLRYHPSKSAHLLRKVILSAMANAAENTGANPDNLRISTIMVDEGPRLKRITARSMGRANRIVKKMAHITVVVEEGDAPTARRREKPKPRPTLAGPVKKGKAAKKDEVAPAEVVEEKIEDVTEAPVEATVEDAPVAEAPESNDEKKEEGA